LYSIVFSASAEKDLSHLPNRYQRLIQVRINQLALDARPPGVKKLREAGPFYRIRQGPYRNVYKIDDTRHEITIDRIKPRQGAYR
jgi:mRNA interferase RelE/StbE